MDTHYIHDLDPVALELGPLVIRWYALAYIAGLLIAWRWGMRLARQSPLSIEPVHIDRFLTWAIIAVIIGGRLGQVLFYDPGFYFANPMEILKVWKGGMAFHGGLLGVLVAMLIFVRINRLPLFALTDIVCAGAPIGIFLGRIANFINGEHWGRPADVSWAVIFPRAGPEPRHPSQLYEAGLEGVGVFLLVLVGLYLLGGLRRPGLISGLFLVGYAVARSVGELFRAPEVPIGDLPAWITYGQILSLPMLLGGLYLVWRALNRPVLLAPSGASDARAAGHG
ncbi:prolipoprotein diacylglyceryl transferase [Marivibrio halodurans]|uniref:Phosphatidylglycerol--prolipoprotein diacylglyceryl transferase n=1 Tax=Marivibrio halodurans TaxID=2039722 RepID=A0A8J7V3Q3_9PROT|nr:prolipoprotein diacylglyceryl transferase [Marivibrio halodurans]MBP5858521.1 prolipoprotein diacylglyceryl transferase [Marivibrio halodurans]